ncbi:MAG: hypothetical protein WCG81_01875 [Candidatus Angelobacter sp.]
MKGISHLSNRWIICFRLITVVTILSSTAACQNNGAASPNRVVPVGQPQAEEASQKYRETFFPKGMPAEEDPDSGQKKPTLYAFYGEARIGDSLSVVLFSKKIPSKEGDSLYTVSLGLLSGKTPSLLVVQVLDLTESMPVQTEEPGNFYRMDGRLDVFNPRAGMSAVHVNLWAVLAGSGSISGSSDLFFKVGQQKLEKLLDLIGTSEFSRLGADQSKVSNSTIFTGDIDGDGTAEIVVERRSVEDLSGKRTMHSDKPVVYKMVGEQYRESGTVGTDELAPRMPGLKKLVRSPFIRVVTTSDTEK